VAVLLFRIIPTSDEVDEWLWVVIGDLPPACLVTDQALNPSDALQTYIGEMQRWIAAVRADKPVDQLMPVATTGGAERLEPTRANADDLERRLRYLEHNILADGTP
jgi:hypothetical protein